MVKWTVIGIVIFTAVLERVVHHLFLTDSFSTRLFTAFIFISIGIGIGVIKTRTVNNKLE